MSASLQDLPPELFLRLAEKINRSGHLLDLALCCRSLYKLILPHLYARVALVYHEKANSYCYIRNFTIRVVQDTQLASYVRDFSLVPQDFSTTERFQDMYESDNEEGNPLEGPLPEGLADVVGSLSDSDGDRDAWIQELEDGAGEEPWLSLLISHLISLERLDLAIPVFADRWEKSIKKLLMREKPFDKGPGLSNLKVFACSCHDDKYGTDMHLLSRALYLPSLQAFYGSMIGSNDDAKNDLIAELKPRSIPLTILEIHQGRINMTDWNNMLQACQNLRTLIYAMGSAWVSFCEHDLQDIYKGIVNVKETVENLWLEFDMLALQPNERLEPLPPISDFMKLRNIRMDMPVLFGQVGQEGEAEPINDLASRLPPSLQTLYIAQTPVEQVEHLWKVLGHLFTQKEALLPELRYLAVEPFSIEDSEPERPDVAKLQAKGREAGVEVRVFERSEVWTWRHDYSQRYEGYQGADGSLTWATKEVAGGEGGFPTFVNAGRELLWGPADD